LVLGSLIFWVEHEITFQMLDELIVYTD
jgi:hypothetical protein